MLDQLVVWRYAYVSNLAVVCKFEIHKRVAVGVRTWSSQSSQSGVYDDGRLLHPASCHAPAVVSCPSWRHSLRFLIVFLHSDRSRTYMEILRACLRASHDSRHRARLPGQMACRRRTHSCVCDVADSVKPCADDLLFPLCRSGYDDCLFR